MALKKFLCLVLISIQMVIFQATLQAKTLTLKNNNQSIQIQYTHKLNDAELQQTQRWLKTVTDALLTVYGEWPKNTFEIDITTTHVSSGPVPWGMVKRGNPDKVSLVINPDYGFKAVEKDWTAYHELSHLLIPYRGYGDLWISEGLASYYQNIIQARSGKFNENKFWMKLIEGFERGRQQKNWSTVKLSKLSGNMRRYRNYMRVHWSGVLFWLSADVKLRENSNNIKSLDRALRQLKNCCEDKQMSARDIMLKLDDITEENIFTPLFYEFRNSFAVPEYRSLLKKMGIEKKPDTASLLFNNDASFSIFRKSIFNGNSP